MGAGPGLGRGEQDLDAREDLALEHLERGAAAGGDVVDAVGEAGLVDRRDAVAAADQGVAGALGDRAGQREGAAGEGRALEQAHRAVPEQHLGVADGGGEAGLGVGADVEGHLGGAEAVALGAPRVSTRTTRASWWP
jgi:hypothetical protein